MMATSGMLCLLVLVLPVAVQCRTQFTRVVGGSDADNQEWPWQLSLRNGASHSCGASLVTTRVAVSAAHCVGGAVALYSLVGGTNQRSCPGGACVTVRPSVVTRHPDFVNSGAVGYPNDISVLTWTDPVALDQALQTIDITTNEDWTSGDCYITGWGRITGGGILPENLQEAKIDILTLQECRDMWSAVQVHETHVCIYDKATQARGACNGDSGGPLVCRRDASSPFQLVGATSWGRTGCATTSPSVYTRTSSFKSWVEQQYPA